MVKSKSVLLYCDDCKCVIEDPKKALVAWSPSDEEHKNVKVVHAPYACPRWKDVADTRWPRRPTVPLPSYLGHLGLCALLFDMESGALHRESAIELIRRLHV